MKVGIMQPYFFPYIGYFSLMAHVDKFIILDDVQFMRHGWIERNRILKPSGGWQYIAIPLQKHEQKTLIRNIYINNAIDWKNKIFAQLVHYKKAPFYKEVMRLLKEIFEQEYNTITELDVEVLRQIAKYLKIKTPIEVFSNMSLEIEPVKAADEWALNICKAIGGVEEYWNPPGGQTFFDRSKYAVAGINVYFQEMELLPYRQLGQQSFENALSILDVLMFNSIDEIKKMMERYNLQ